MSRSKKYNSQRALAAALNTSGSLVGKWLHGDVKQIKSRKHLGKLPELLETPEDYFLGSSSEERLTRLEEQGAAMRVALVAMADAAGVEVPDVLRRDEEQAL